MDVSWELLLAELFAEDFVVLNGIDGWQLPSAPPPTDTQLDSMLFDTNDPFVPERRRWRLWVRQDRMRFRTVRLRHWTFADVRLTSPRRRDFDLFLYEGDGARPFASSRRTGRLDRVRRILPPGRYVVGLAGYRGNGSARLSVSLD